MPASPSAKTAPTKSGLETTAAPRITPRNPASSVEAAVDAASLGIWKLSEKGTEIPAGEDRPSPMGTPRIDPERYRDCDEGRLCSPGACADAGRRLQGRLRVRKSARRSRPPGYGRAPLALSPAVVAPRTDRCPALGRAPPPEPAQDRHLARDRPARRDVGGRLPPSFRTSARGCSDRHRLADCTLGCRRNPRWGWRLLSDPAF